MQVGPSAGRTNGDVLRTVEVSAEPDQTSIISDAASQCRMYNYMEYQVYMFFGPCAVVSMKHASCR